MLIWDGKTRRKLKEELVWNLVRAPSICLLVGLIVFGRIYLGMHSLIDIAGGLVIELVILAMWLTVYECVDAFIVSGQNVTSFWAALSFLLLFAYPTPELPTPCFEYHTAFDGVIFGIVAGIQQTYHQFHHEAVPRIFTSRLMIPAFLERMLVGIPMTLIVKFCSKTREMDSPGSIKHIGYPHKINQLYSDA